MFARRVRPVLVRAGLLSALCAVPALAGCSGGEPARASAASVTPLASTDAADTGAAPSASTPAPSASATPSAAPTKATPRATTAAPKPKATPKAPAPPKATPKPTPKAKPKPKATPKAKAGDVVWLKTPVITHTRDYHDLSAYLNPAVPKNWTSPVDYADGTVTIKVELISDAHPEVMPVYVLVGWTDANGKGYVRGGEMFTKPSGTITETVPVKEWQRVVNGRDTGNAGNGWDWKHAFGTVNSDVWSTSGGSGGMYPIKVRITMTLHPKR